MVDRVPFEDVEPRSGDTFKLASPSRFNVMEDMLATARHTSTEELYADQLGPLDYDYAKAVSTLLALRALTESLIDEITSVYRVHEE